MTLEQGLWMGVVAVVVGGVAFLAWKKGWISTEVFAGILGILTLGMFGASRLKSEPETEPVPPPVDESSFREQEREREKVRVDTEKERIRSALADAPMADEEDTLLSGLRSDMPDKVETA